jgi:phosphoribosylformylglycinamidine synthase
LGWTEVKDVRVGRVVEFDLGGDADGAEGRVRAMCDKLLANTVIESYRVDIVD